MKKKLHFTIHCTAILFAIFLFTTSSLAGQIGNTLEMAESLKVNVIGINTIFSENSEPGYGMGVIIGEKNDSLYLATAAHVVLGDGYNKNPKSILIKFHNLPDPFIAKLILWDSLDFALLSVKKPTPFKWETACADFSVKQNAPVRFIGSNEQRELTWDPSGQGEITKINLDNIVVKNISIVEGNSGAPLVGQYGIIGLVTKIDYYGGIGLNIQTVKKILDNKNKSSCFSLHSTPFCKSGYKEEEGHSTPQKISGTIFDCINPTIQRIEGVKVSCLETNTFGISDSNGWFEISANKGLSKYTLTFEKGGYEKYNIVLDNYKAFGGKKIFLTSKN